MAQSINSNNAGTVLPSLLTSLIEGVDAMDKGLVAVSEGIPGEKLFVPELEVTGTLNAYSPEPITDGAFTSGTLTYLERELELADVTFPIKAIVPNAWRAVWADLAPDPRTPFHEMMLNPEVERKFVERAVQRVAKLNAPMIWSGDTSVTGTTDRYDGVLTKLIATGGYVDLFETGDTAFSSSNIDDYLLRAYEALLDQPALLSHPDTKFIVSWKTFNFFQNSEIGLSTKGPTYSNIGGVQQGIDFKGIPLIPSNGFPNDVLLCTRTSADPLNSTLHLGFRRRADVGDYWFGRIHPSGQVWGLRIDYSIGTCVTTPSNILLLDVRA